MHTCIYAAASVLCEMAFCVDGTCYVVVRVLLFSHLSLYLQGRSFNSSAVLSG